MFTGTFPSDLFFTSNRDECSTCLCTLWIPVKIRLSQVQGGILRVPNPRYKRKSVSEEGPVKISKITVIDSW